MTVATDPAPTALLENSYAIVRGLFDPGIAGRLREICERVLGQWRRAPRSDNPPVGLQVNYMRHVNVSEYHRDHPDDLAFLLDAVGAPQVTKAIGEALDEDYFFQMISLYFNPTGDSQDGFWHKDKIGAEADVALVPETGAGLQLQIALVPGSHWRVLLRARSKRSVWLMRSATIARTRCRVRCASSCSQVMRRSLPSCASIAGATTPTNCGGR